MLKFLKAYGKRASEASTEDFLFSQVTRILEEDIDGFLDIIEDKDVYDMKAFISDSVQAGLILKTNKRYTLPGGAKLCDESDFPSLDNAVIYLLADANQDVYSSLKARLNNAKD